MKLTDALTVLTAMITPAILIVASGSLLLTTSQRLSRSIERSRQLSDQLRKLIVTPELTDLFEDEHDSLVVQLRANIRRVKVLQSTLSAIYIALGIFVAITIVIAIMEVFNLQYPWVLTVMSISGAGCLFYASILLILESGIAASAVKYEMTTIVKRVEKYKPRK
jgi:hypothetical protein